MATGHRVAAVEAVVKTVGGADTAEMAVRATPVMPDKAERVATESMAAGTAVTVETRPTETAGSAVTAETRPTETAGSAVTEETRPTETAGSAVTAGEASTAQVARAGAVETVEGIGHSSWVLAQRPRMGVMSNP